MNNKLFIPEKIKVGYQSRTDTYTKKLAYIIYFDEKGVLRKEKSWQSWRDDKIDPIDIENKPYSGFTLNKGILRDGYWGGGHNMVRIFDDRGMEFEITVSNLMYILMGNDCNKRVLSGEFVYAWNGTELILLPTNTEEYKTSTTFTSLKTNKVSIKELQENVGCMFKTKDLKDWVYLGRMDQNDRKYVYPEDKDGRRMYGNGYYKYTREKRHIFYNLETKAYFSENSPKKLAYVIEPNKVHDFEELLEGYFCSTYYTQIKEVVVEIGEDITHKFTAENRHERILKDRYCYFVDNEGNYFYANTPSYIEKSKNLLSPNYRTLYYQSNEYYRAWGEERYNPTTNEGYTEGNIQRGGIKFNLLNITMKAVDGRVIPYSGSDLINNYFFTSDVKITINK